jgi:hypothetical protein
MSETKLNSTPLKEAHTYNWSEGAVTVSIHTTIIQNNKQLAKHHLQWGR